MNIKLDNMEYYPVETINDVMSINNMTLKEVSDFFGIPYRTVQNWSLGKAKPTKYILNMMANILVINAQNKVLHDNFMDQLTETEQIRNKIERAQDLLHDGRIREGIKIIDNIRS